MEGRSAGEDSRLVLVNPKHEDPSKNPEGSFSSELAPTDLEITKSHAPRGNSVGVGLGNDGEFGGVSK
jgi:hypothetical protein